MSLSTMTEFLDFFTHVPTSFRATMLIGGIVLFWVLEGVIPLNKKSYKKISHAGVNGFFTLTTMIIGFGLANALLYASDTVATYQFGLLYLFEIPLWAQVVIGVILLDSIGAYLVHYLEHKVKWMWRFHLIHHSDTNIDVTSGLRHHPGETVFRMCFTIIAVVLIGAPMGTIMLYQSLSVLFTHLTHANVSVFGKLDKPFSYIFVTPNMHKVHHHYQQPWTDTNFGNIFSIWDRLFGTFQHITEMDQVIYGIDTHMDTQENTAIGNLLAIPFQKYRSPIDSESVEEY